LSIAIFVNMDKWNWPDYIW